MEAFVWVLICIVAVIAGCIRLAFTFPEKANKPSFWIISSILTIVIGVIIYIVVKIFNL